jgi:hypothetical protein
MAPINRLIASEALLKLLKALMSEPLLEDFALAGGTALALHMGHRVSEDIDLFSSQDFDTLELQKLFVDKYHATRLYENQNTICVYISGIKVDCLSHPYPLLADLDSNDGVRLYALPDIAAMKLNAISGRGMKKDFWDLGVMLEQYSLQEMIGFFRQKYSIKDAWHLLKSLNEIDVADLDDTPLHSLTELSWDKIKMRIKLELRKII